MAINYAAKYSAKVDEAFSLSSFTEIAVNKDYDFVGAKTVNVYSIPTTPLVDYIRSGANRYGTPAELQDAKQELTLSQDKSFTFTVDKGNDADQMGVKNAGRALRRQIDEQVTPMIDIYRIAQMVAKAGKTVTTTITTANAYSMFLDGQTALTNAKVPLTGRVAFVTPSFYKAIKLDTSFVQASDMAQNMLKTGVIGMVDGVSIVQVPESYFPENVQFVITHKVATVSPLKLAEYNTHIDPPGISGTLVEGRLYYDAFVLDKKKDAIYVHKNAAEAPTG